MTQLTSSDEGVYTRSKNNSQRLDASRQHRSKGNVHSFLEETLTILQNKKVRLIRCDSGFYSDSFLSELEKKS